MVFFLFGVDMNVVVSKPEPDFLPGVMFKYNQDVNETAFEGGWGVSMLRLVFWVLVGLLISGCSTSGQNPRWYGNESSSNFRVPVDSELVLNRELIVVPRSQRVFFQRGRVLARHHEVNRFQPWCVLRLDRSRDIEVRITPEEFAIHDVRRQYLNRVALLGPIQVAQRRTPGGTSAAYEVVASLMELRSERQPDVANLACTRWRRPTNTFHVTIRNIRETLGDVFSLELASRDSLGLEH